jgi:hypothetical protein
LKGDNLIVFYYFGASEIWPDEMDGFRWEGLYKEAIVFSTALNIRSVCLSFCLHFTKYGYDLQRGLNIDYLMSSEHFKLKLYSFQKEIHK